MDARTVTTEWGECYFHGASVRAHVTLAEAREYRASVNGNAAETRRHVDIVDSGDTRTDDAIVSDYWRTFDERGLVYHG